MKSTIEYTTRELTIALLKANNVTTGHWHIALKSHPGQPDPGAVIRNTGNPSEPAIPSEMVFGFTTVITRIALVTCPADHPAAIDAARLWEKQK